MKIIAGIVTFNPDINRLNDNINSIYKQVEKVILFDNGSNNVKYIEKLIQPYKNCILLKNNQNIGIAAALNRIFQYGEKYADSYVLTLDQDSICPENIIRDYSKYLSSNIGILTPQIKDIHLNELYYKSNNSIDEVKRCITSAALTNIDAWKKVNGFDEDMFIDCVDFDFCDRIRRAGYKIIRVNNVILMHEIGYRSKHYIGPFTIIVKNHSAFRKYYIVRNTIYLARKHKNKFEELKSIAQGLKEIILVILFENDKINKIQLIKNGMYDGIKMKIGEMWK